MHPQGAPERDAVPFLCVVRSNCSYTIRQGWDATAAKERGGNSSQREAYVPSFQLSPFQLLNSNAYQFWYRRHSGGSSESGFAHNFIVLFFRTQFPMSSSDARVNKALVYPNLQILKMSFLDITTDSCHVILNTQLTRQPSFCIRYDFSTYRRTVK